MSHRQYSHKEVKHAANEALKSGYHEKDIRHYFHQKGYKPFETRQIINKTDYFIFQSVYQLIVIIGIVNLSLGIFQVVFRLSFLTDIGINYFHIIYGLTLITFSILIKRRVFWAFLAVLGLLFLDIVFTVRMLGSVDNIIGPLFAKLLLFFWTIKGLVPFYRLIKKKNN